MAEGDAMKADKRRKKKMREEQEAAVDSIFGGSDEDDGGDYNPDAAEEPEYIEAGADDNTGDNVDGSDMEGEDDEADPRPNKRDKRKRRAGNGRLECLSSC